MKAFKKKVSGANSSKDSTRPTYTSAPSKKKNKEELDEDLTMKESEENQKKLAPDEEL